MRTDTLDRLLVKCLGVIKADKNPKKWWGVKVLRETAGGKAEYIGWVFKLMIERADKLGLMVRDVYQNGKIVQQIRLKERDKMNINMLINNMYVEVRAMLQQAITDNPQLAGEFNQLLEKHDAIFNLLNERNEKPIPNLD